MLIPPARIDRFRCAVVVAAALAAIADAGGDRTSAETVAFAQDRLNRATADIAADARASAAAALIEAEEAADEEDAGDLSDEARRKFLPKLSKLRSALKKARDTTNDTSQSARSAEKSVAKAIVASKAADAVLQKFDGIPFVMQESDARTAGIHGPGATVRFRVDRTAGCTEEPVVVVVDLGGGGVPDDPVDLRGEGPGSRFFEVVLGPGRGAGRVEVTVCGQTRTWLLQNTGDPDDLPPPVPPEVSRFDGNWVGAYQGRATIPGLGSMSVSGAVGFSVAEGHIAITEPGQGQGRLQASGRGKFAGGGGGVGEASYSFQGFFIEFHVGGASATGNWRSSFPGGTARGSWSAGRN